MTEAAVGQSTDFQHADLVHCLEASNHFEGEYDEMALDDAYRAWQSLDVLGVTEESLLHAHGLMMFSRTSCEEGQKGNYRYGRVSVGDRLMPSAGVVRGLTTQLIERIPELPSDKVADVFVKIHPFADGNGRMARLLLYHLNDARDEPMIPMEGQVGLVARRDFTSWLEVNYPQCDADLNPVDVEQFKAWSWTDIVRGEMTI